MMHPAIATRLFGTPLLIARGKLGVIIQALEKRLQVQLEHGADLEVLMEPFELDEGDGRKRFPLQVVDGVAVVDVHGTLVHRHHGMNAASGMSSYERITAEVREAVERSDVRGVLLNFDSPGGEVAGSYDACDELFELRGQKPIVGFANEFMTSAAYMLASACDRIYATQSAMTGSIGVVLANRDETAKQERAGVVVTEIHAGARKVDCSPFQTLDEDRRASLQGQVDRFFDLFVDKVARNRGLAGANIRGTEAAMYIGAQALGHQLIDGVRRPADVLGELAGGASRSRIMLNGGELMRKFKAGESLATGLEGAIAEKAEADGTTREQVIADMAADAGQGPEEVEAVLTGAINCPTVATLESYAGTLGAALPDLLAWGREDGCEYPQLDGEEEDAPADAPAEDEPDGPAAQEDMEDEDEEDEESGAKAATLKPNAAARRFLMAADSNPGALAALLRKLAPKTSAKIHRQSLARVRKIKAAALHGQAALADRLAADPSVSVLEAKAVLLDAEKARRGRHLKTLASEDRQVAKVGTAPAEAQAVPTATSVHMLDDERDALIEQRWDRDPKIRDEFRKKGAWAAYARRNPGALVRRR